MGRIYEKQGAHPGTTYDPSNKRGNKGPRLGDIR